MGEAALKNPEGIRIAVLDDYAHIAQQYFEPLQNDPVSKVVDIIYPERTYDPRKPQELDELVDLLKPFTVISSMRERTIFPDILLNRLPNLKLLQTTHTRNKGIDTERCKELGIAVAGTGSKPNAPRSHDITNEQAWALILGVAKNTAGDDLRLKTEKSRWQDGFVCQLAERKLGVLGFGRLGQQVALTGKLGFGMDILCWSTSLTQEKADEVARTSGLPPGSFKVCSSKDEIFRGSDIVSIHYVLSDRSRGLVGEKELSLMKTSAILINTSRGPLIQEEALLETLRQGRIRGAGLDVHYSEPLAEDSPWRSTEWGKDGKSLVLLTPHMAYVEEETLKSWYQQSARNIKRWLKGEELEYKLV
jgi:lactate dehydrogenase-like 2-hydroxyacid dehydrogenase